MGINDTRENSPCGVKMEGERIRRVLALFCVVKGPRCPLCGKSLLQYSDVLLIPPWVEREHDPGAAGAVERLRQT